MNKNKLYGGDKFSNQIFIMTNFFLISTHLINNENIRLIQIQGILNYINEKG